MLYNQRWVIVILLVHLFISMSRGSPSSYFDGGSKAALRLLAMQTLGRDTSPDDLLHSLATLQLLDVEIPQSSKDLVCRVAKDAASADELKAVYTGASLSEIMRCGSSKSPKVEAIIKEGLRGNAEMMHYAVKTAVLLGVEISVDGLTEVITAFATLQGSDGTFKPSHDAKTSSPSATGHALVALAALGRLAPAPQQQETLRNIAIKLDRLMNTAAVTEKYARFVDEDKMATTNIVHGAIALTEQLETDSPISEELLGKLAQYFVDSRFTSSIARAAASLRGAQLVAKKVICVTLEHPYGIKIDAKGDEKKLKVSVTDIFGGALPSPVSLKASKVLSSMSEEALAEDKPFERLNATLFALPFLGALAHDEDVYSILLTVVPEDGGEPLEVERMLKTMTTATVGLTELMISRSKDFSESESRKASFHFPETVHESFALGSEHFLRVTLEVQTNGRRHPAPHQLLLRLTNAEESQHNTVIVPKLAESGHYSISLPVSQLSSSLKYKSGDYELSLLVGDIFLHNQIVWHICNLQFHLDPAPYSAPAFDVPIMQALPEIFHTFKPEDQRPGTLPALIFSALALVPLALFFVALHRLQAFDLAKFPSRDETVPFAASVALQVGIAAILGLYVVFWLGLTLLQTLKYSLVIACFNFVVGNKALSYLAQQKSKRE